MLQRIQSLYLALVIICQAITLFLPFVYFQYEGNTYEIAAFGIYDDAGEKLVGNWMQWLIPLASLASIACALIALIQFKNRKLQMKLAQVVLFICIAQVFFIGTSINGIRLKMDSDFTIAISSFIVPICGILSLMAKKAIKKDDDLVKSVDRIR